MALAMGVVACNKEGEGRDGGQAMATRPMAMMWAAMAAMAAAAAALLMFPVSKCSFSIFFQKSSENNMVCLFWLECPAKM